jgi:hypothetical protein
MFCSEAETETSGYRRGAPLSRENRRGAPLTRVNPRRSLRSAGSVSVSHEMIVPAHNHNQPSPLPAPADPPVIRCKKCKVPLPDTTWKNCASCRKNRTESYNRWKKSASLRSMTTMDPSESLLRLCQHSSSLFRTVDYSTSSQAPGPTDPPDHHSNEPSHRGDPSGSSPLANDQPRRTSTSTVPRPAEAIEYQWSDELIEDLLALPPRSRYIGTFSIIADPAVNNSTRVRLFADQLHARAVHMSCVHLFPSTFPQPCLPFFLFGAGTIHRRVP